MTSADALLAEVDRLSPPDRTRRVIEVARAAAPGDRAALLAELGRRDRYARQLAVTMAAATGETAHLAVALHDPYPQVRAQALAAQALPEAAVEALLADGPLAARLEVYAWLRRNRRTALADRLLEPTRERWGDGEAARLLAACSPETVRAALPELGYAVTGWSGLTARHPETVVGYVEAELGALAEESRVAWWGRSHRVAWWGRSHRVASALARHRPADLLALYERWLTGPLPPGQLGHLTRLLGVDPARVVRWLRADPARACALRGWAPGRAARDHLATVSDADLGGLLRASGPDQTLVLRVLRGLAPSRREAVFDVAYAARDLAAEILPDELLRLLPHARRHAEARRMLTLPPSPTTTR